MTDNNAQRRRHLLLELVRQGEGQWSAITIDLRYSALIEHDNRTVYEHLKSLEANGFVRQIVTPGSGIDKWELTTAGKSLLDAHEV